MVENKKSHFEGKISKKQQKIIKNGIILCKSECKMQVSYVHILSN